MKIILATSNQHKVKEYNEMAQNYDLEFVSLKDIGFTEEIIEDGKTFEENAIIKVKAIAKTIKLPVLADDSGIIIEELGANFPGVYSHRFQIQNGGAYETNKIVVSKCPGSPAYFTCLLALANFDNDIHVFKGIYKGKIANKVSSPDGFGYDPIFIPEGYNVTVNELSDEEKNSISHRHRAFEQFINFLKPSLK